MVIIGDLKPFGLRAYMEALGMAAESKRVRALDFAIVYDLLVAHTFFKNLSSLRK
jgi:hypothetical protein